MLLSLLHFYYSYFGCWAYYFRVVRVSWFDKSSLLPEANFPSHFMDTTIMSFWHSTVQLLWRLCGQERKISLSFSILSSDLLNLGLFKQGTSRKQSWEKWIFRKSVHLFWRRCASTFTGRYNLPGENLISIDLWLFQNLHNPLHSCNGMRMLLHRRLKCYVSISLHVLGEI